MKKIAHIQKFYDENQKQIGERARWITQEQMAKIYQGVYREAFFEQLARIADSQERIASSQEKLFRVLANAATAREARLLAREEFQEAQKRRQQSQVSPTNGQWWLNWLLSGKLPSGTTRDEFGNFLVKMAKLGCPTHMAGAGLFFKKLGSRFQQTTRHNKRWRVIPPLIEARRIWDDKFTKIEWDEKHEWEIEK